VNIYSHLVGSAVFIAIPVYLFKNEIPPRYAVASRADVVVCLTYFVGVAICFCLSATWDCVSWTRINDWYQQIPHGDVP